MNKTKKPAHILVVDDETQSRKLLQTLLAADGHAVHGAGSGEEALGAAAAQLPDLILLDIMMPGMDGFDVARRLKADERTRSIPIILVTSLEDRESRLKGLEAGAEEFVSKPVDRAELLARTRNLLKLKEYHDFLATHNAILDEQVRARTAELLAKDENLERVNRALRTLSACNVALVHAATEEQLFGNVCRHIVQTGGHLFADISLRGTEQEEIPRHVFHCGSDAIARRLVDLERDPEHARQSLIPAALYARQTKVYNGGTEYRLDELAGLGIASGLALPLVNEDRLYGALTVLSSSPHAFDAAEVKLMQELASDVAFGIATMGMRAERDRAAQAELRAAGELRRALEQTITAIALTLEKRDPFAAGHEQRVSGLAGAIAAEMGLPPQQVEGIHFGALLHNIGTVAVPAEILNRPGKLSELQFALVKLHPQTGFEIVKDIPFPWPVAQMVQQHHERLDGSGYPLGLKGEQIIPEARVLAVADVYEAMLEYRPYRAALTRDAALEVLIQGRGVKFDRAAVDACLRVVRQPDQAGASP